MKRHTCLWIFVPAAPGVTAKYCGKDVAYHMVKDDDGNTRRKYDAFYTEHDARAAQDEEES